eukprot:scaffold769_cov105-Isochrysis_galbana.AAC.7
MWRVSRRESSAERRGPCNVRLSVTRSQKNPVWFSHVARAHQWVPRSGLADWICVRQDQEGMRAGRWLS